MVSSTALAVGSVRVARTTIQEDSKQWKIKLTINYGSLPHLAHIPMVLSFTPTAIYERYVDDSTGDTPARRVVRLRNQATIDLPMDVGFADMSGKMFKITKFKFKLSRGAGFEAGEYTLKIHKASGGVVGRPIKLRLEGKNKVINRKAIEFKAKAPKPKSKPDPSDMPEPSGPRAAEDSGPDLSDIEDISDEEAAAIKADGPPGAKKRSSGCGCEVVGEPAQGQLGLLLLAAVALALVFVRRRSS